MMVGGSPRFKASVTPSGDGKQVGPATEAPPPKSSRRVRRGFPMFQIQIPASAANVPYHCVGTDAVFPLVYVASLLANSGTVYIGMEGNQLQDLNPGDVFPYTDLSPQDIWAYTTSSSAQTIVITCFGDPER